MPRPTQLVPNGSRPEPDKLAAWNKCRISGAARDTRRLGNGHLFKRPTQEAHRIERVAAFPLERVDDHFAFRSAASSSLRTNSGGRCAWPASACSTPIASSTLLALARRTFAGSSSEGPETLPDIPRWRLLPPRDLGPCRAISPRRERGPRRTCHRRWRLRGW